MWHTLLQGLYHAQLLAVTTLSLDGTFIPSFAFAEMTGYAGEKHRIGVKLSWHVDGNGLPLSIVSAAENYHNLSLSKRNTCHLTYILQVSLR